MRWYYFFQYDTLPALRLQEQFSLDVSGNDAHDDYTAALLWQEGETASPIPRCSWPAAKPQRNSTRRSSGGMREELERLGHLHYAPSFSFSIPQKAAC